MGYLFSYINWNPNTEIFNLGSLTVHWYGLTWVLATLVAFLIGRWILIKEKGNDDKIYDITLLTFIFTFIGARLGHVVFYDLPYFISNPIEIFYLWNGGMASHGAILGAIFSLFLYSRINKSYSFYWLVDRAVLTFLPGLAIVRLGNLINSELYGTPSDLPWAFIFEMVDDIPRHPTPLYEAIMLFAVFIILIFIYKRNYNRKPGLFIGLSMLVVSVSRFLIEFFKYPDSIWFENIPLITSQYISIPFMLAGLYILFRYFKGEKNRPLNY